jgi:hypothetical protein
MEASPASAPDRTLRGPRWPWIALGLGLALAWSALVRVPLVVNAASHLDSDLAVDGLTLLEALHGRWRWHYPGTPHMGTLPVLLSLPQAAAWGANPATLVSGGIVGQGLLTLAVFLLAWRAFGPGVAGWSLVPLTFASTGMLWLSARITGGHLLTAAWHAGSFALLYEALTRGGTRSAAALGLWCGLGLWLDAMSLVTLAGVVPAALWGAGPSRRGLVFLLALLAGTVPREVGRRVEPHDPYREQFTLVRDRRVLRDHARLLLAECLPRLIVGHRLPGLPADPDPRALGTPGPLSDRPDRHPAALAVTVVGLALFGASLWALALHRSSRAATAVRLGLLASAAAVCAGFVFNRNIYNADNYRYIVTLIVPWAMGFGLAMHGLARRGPGGRAAAALCGLVLAGLMTYDAARWYARFGWLDARAGRARVTRADPALSWLVEHPAVASVSGDYWDVYRLAFLTGGRVRGVPLPVYPDRFPEWSRGLPGGHGEVLLVRPGGAAPVFLREALAAGGRVLFQAPGMTIVSWPPG